MTELMPAVAAWRSSSSSSTWSRCSDTGTAAASAIAVAAAAIGSQPPVVEADRVLADLQDHRGVDLLGALDHGFGVFQGDDVEGADRDVARGGAVDQLTRGDQRHIDLPFVGTGPGLDRSPTERDDTQQYKDTQATKSNTTVRSATMQTWLVGLDVGTTSCKAVVMTPDGREVASGRAPTPWTTTGPRHPDRGRGAGGGRPGRAGRRGRRRGAHDRAARAHRGCRGGQHGRVGSPAGPRRQPRSHR